MNLQETQIPGYKKDKISGVIININQNELSSYRKQKAAILERNRLAKKVVELEQELASQKKTLQTILLELGILKI